MQDAKTGARCDLVNIKAVIARDGYVCQVCGKPTGGTHAPLSFQVSLDHKTPIAEGGAHVFDNVQITHHACNAAKDGGRGNAGSTWTTRGGRRRASFWLPIEAADMVQAAADAEGVPYAQWLRTAIYERLGASFPPMRRGRPKKPAKGDAA